MQCSVGPHLTHALYLFENLPQEGASRELLCFLRPAALSVTVAVSDAELRWLTELAGETAQLSAVSKTYIDAVFAAARPAS